MGRVQHVDPPESLALPVSPIHASLPRGAAFWAQWQQRPNEPRGPKCGRFEHGQELSLIVHPYAPAERLLGEMQGPRG